MSMMRRRGGRGGFSAGPIDDAVIKTVGISLAVIIALSGITVMFLWPYVSAHAWKTMLFTIALVLNLILSSVQAVVLANLWEYSKDHMYAHKNALSGKCLPRSPARTRPLVALLFISLMHVWAAECNKIAKYRPIHVIKLLCFAEQKRHLGICADCFEVSALIHCE